MLRWQIKGRDEVYCSRSEAMISLLLIRYCNYAPREGETLHVHTGRANIDFLLKFKFDTGVSINDSSQGQSESALLKVNGNDEVKFLLNETAVEWHPFQRQGTLEDYKKQRRNALPNSMELIVVSALKEVYNLALKRFCSPLPDYGEIEKQYNRSRHSVKRVTLKYLNEASMKNIDNPGGKISKNLEVI